MANRLKIAMAQLNMVVGDITGNAGKIIESAKYARLHLGADCVVFPELALSGYPPEDLVLRPGFQRQVFKGLDIVRNNVSGIDVVVGFPEAAQEGLYNSACVIRDGLSSTPTANTYCLITVCSTKSAILLPAANRW